MACPFCAIVAGEAAAHVVFDDPAAVGFLDHRPVFPGHVLLVPHPHYETLADLPGDQVGPLFHTARRVGAAVQEAMDAPGLFLALNNVVSQSVPHLHVHLVPRRFKDGLRGFFWPRQKYGGDQEMAAVAGRIRDALAGSGAA